MANLYLSISNIQWHQSSWKLSPVHTQVEVAAQSIVHAVRTVCIAQSCAYVIAMKSPYSIGVQDVLSDYDGDGDGNGDDNDNDSE